MERRRGGLVVRIDGALRFVPASVAVQVTALPSITRVPGSPDELFGIALHGGTIVPVLAAGEGRTQMIVCQWAGELVGVVGGDVVKAGIFELVGEREDAVRFEGELASLLDLGALCARVQAGGAPGG